jgi:hypothetical protein
MFTRVPLSPEFTMVLTASSAEAVGSGVRGLRSVMGKCRPRSPRLNS